MNTLRAGFPRPQTLAAAAYKCSQGYIMSHGYNTSTPGIVSEPNRIE